MEKERSKKIYIFLPKKMGKKVIRSRNWRKIYRSKQKVKNWLKLGKIVVEKVIENE